MCGSDTLLFLFDAHKRLWVFEVASVSRYLDWLLLAIVVLVSLASPLIVLEFVSGRY